jgi:hypothetical protein
MQLHLWGRIKQSLSYPLPAIPVVPFLNKNAGVLTLLNNEGVVENQVRDTPGLLLKKQKAKVKKM